MHFCHFAEFAAADPVLSPAAREPAVLVPQPHGDKPLLQQFLGELRLPLASMQAMLEMGNETTLPAAAQVVWNAVSSQTDYLLDLVGDYVELERLRAAQVGVRPERVDFARWIAACLATVAHKAACDGKSLELRYRNFVPSHLLLDGAVAARAVQAMLRVALQRAAVGQVQVRIAYGHDTRDPSASQLIVEIEAEGEPPAVGECDDVWAPFAVRDAAMRPLLGFCNAKRLARLLGGDLLVGCRGQGRSGYVLAVVAPPAAGAVWTDSDVHREHCLGPVWPAS